MGFWSALGKWALPAAGAVAAPFTGGASLALTGLAGAAGAGLGAAAQGAGANRSTKFNGQMELQKLIEDRQNTFFNQQNTVANQGFQNQMAAAGEGRASGNDAFRRLMMANNVLNPFQGPQVAGQYNTPQRQYNEAERQGAQGMSDEVMARLLGGPQVAAPTLPTPSQAPLDVDRRLLDGSGFEKWAGILSPILGGIGRMQPQSGPSASDMAYIRAGGQR